ncbi:MAG: glycosyltransferase [Myxococcota bacterium]|nr:glycosyltransferase [Myxococcota bacterium]
MRIGMFIPEFPTQTHVFFWREIAALRGLGLDVSIVSTRRPKEPCPHEFAREAAPLTHYVYPPALGPSARGMGHGRGVVRVAKYLSSLTAGSRGRALGYAVCAAHLADLAERRGIDHLHVHSCADAAHVAAMAHLWSGLPYSLHLHGDLPVYGTDHAMKMRHASFIAAAARPLQEQIISQIGVPRERVFRMIMGVDLSRLRLRARPTEEPGHAAGPLHLVSISRLADCKGHRFALAAVRRAIDAGAELRYTIAGSGPDRVKIEAEVARLGLGEQVRFAGSLSEQGVAELLEAADVFVLTSVGMGEASPVAVMEAMATGVPAICSRIGGTADMVDSGVDGLLVAQEDVGGITDALLTLHRDRAMIARLGAAARRRAEREFDATVLARQLVATIETMRGTSPVGSCRHTSDIERPDTIDATHSAGAPLL